MSTASQARHGKLVIGIVDFQQLTLLLLGDAEAFGNLINLIENAEKGSEYDMAEWGRCVNVRLTLTFEEKSSLKQNGDTLKWQISIEAARRFSDQSRALADQRIASGHHYLDAETNQTGLQILASKGEYDSDIIFSR